jgi:hypothetical protein
VGDHAREDIGSDGERPDLGLLPAIKPHRCHEFDDGAEAVITVGDEEEDRIGAPSIRRCFAEAIGYD